MTSPNVKVIQAAYESFAKGDVPGVLGALAQDVEWTEAEGFPYQGTYHGPEAVLNNVFMPIGTEWEGFQVVPRQIIDGGDHVVTVGEYSGTYKATGRPFKAPFAHVWTLKDGKVARFRQFVDAPPVQRAIQQ